MSPILRIIEILILVVLPLLIIYLRSSWPNKDINLNAMMLPLIWYIFYAPLHELGHVLGCVIVGAEIKDYQLFAHFWEGNFGFAFVETKEGLSENMDSFVILILPYILDLIAIITGYFLLTKYKIKNSFWFGLVFLQFNIRPVYDLIDNFIGYYINHSDFVLASRIVGYLSIFIFIITSVITGIILILLLFKKYKQYPRVIAE